LWWFVEHSGAAWWKGGFCERGEERVARRGQRKVLRYAGKPLQGAKDIAK